MGRVLYPGNDRLSWDSSNVGNPVVLRYATPTDIATQIDLQVSCFVGDNEQRWFMYYTGLSVQDASQIYGDLPLIGTTGNKEVFSDRYSLRVRSSS